jgi:hypothetical protein
MTGGKTDRQTDMTKLIDALRNFANALVLLKADPKSLQYAPVYYFRIRNACVGRLVNNLFHALRGTYVLPLSGSSESKPSCVLGSEFHHLLVQHLPKLPQISVDLDAI